MLLNLTEIKTQKKWFRFKTLKSVLAKQLTAPL